MPLKGVKALYHLQNVWIFVSLGVQKPRKYRCACEVF
jgi:hypothetical protein